MNICKPYVQLKDYKHIIEFNKIRIYFNLTFLIIFANLIYSQELKEARINGKIINGTDTTIQIGGNNIPLSETGEFKFITSIKFPNFFEVRYGNMDWVVYLEPGKTVELAIKSNDISSLIYNDDLKKSNDYLKKAYLFNTEINNFFNKNWVQIHCQNESKYISIIDSIKGLYLNPLASYQCGNKNISKDFIKLFTADVHFGLNVLIVQYPQVHRRYTGEKTILSQKCYDYLNSMSIDNVAWIDLPSYKKYCKAWIDYNSDIIVGKDTEQKHFNLKKMNVLFRFLPTIFKNQELSDYWLSEYLSEHIQNTWLANSERYIKEFFKSCKTEVYKTRINELYSSCLNAEKDHIVKRYKTLNGFDLEAHIFYPGSIITGEKRPCIVIFHGGGFVLGNPSWAFEKAKHYANLGMIAIAAQYRLSNFKDITPIDAIRDSKDLMLWVRKNADSLGIIEDRIAASGWSVGGQLCLVNAIFPDTLPDRKTTTVPNALLLTSPGVGTGGWFTELLNDADIDPTSLSPVDHVTRGLPPTIILQGRDDTVTPLKDVQLFHDKMAADGNYCEIWVYDGVGHLFSPTQLGDQGWPRPDPAVQRQADERTVEFLIKFGFINKN